MVKDAPAVTFASTAHPTANIDIDNRSMLADKATQAAVATLSLTVTQGTTTTPILQADGSIVDNDVRGVLDVDAQRQHAGSSGTAMGSTSTTTETRSRTRARR